MSKGSIRIQYSNNIDTFYCGQYVVGKIYIDIHKDIQVDSIQMKCEGHSHVRWVETVTRNKERVRETRTGHERYFETVIPVWGNGTSQTLHVGHHEFEFRFQVPHGIPSSYQGTYGYIKYSCSAKIVKSALLSFNIEETVPFTVISMFDLNLQQHLLVPAQFTKEKTVGALIFKRGDINCTLGLTKQGFVWGEDIPVTLLIENKSSKHIPDCSISLTQQITFVAGVHYKYVRDVIVCMNTEGCSENTTKKMDYIIKTSSLSPPLQLHYCKIIKVQHRIEVEVTIPGFHLNSRVSGDIFFGSLSRQPIENHFPSAPYPVDTFATNNSMQNCILPTPTNIIPQHILDHPSNSTNSQSRLYPSLPDTSQPSTCDKLPHKYLPPPSLHDDSAINRYPDGNYMTNTGPAAAWPWNIEMPPPPYPK